MTAVRAGRPRGSAFFIIEDIEDPIQHERRSQVRGLLLIALAVILFSLLRAGLRHVFTPAGWWRLW